MRIVNIDNKFNYKLVLVYLGDGVRATENCVAKMKKNKNKQKTKPTENKIQTKIVSKIRGTL